MFVTGLSDGPDTGRFGTTTAGVVVAVAPPPPATPIVPTTSPVRTLVIVALPSPATSRSWRSDASLMNPPVTSSASVGLESCSSQYRVDRRLERVEVRALRILLTLVGDPTNCEHCHDGEDPEDHDHDQQLDQCESPIGTGTVRVVAPATGYICSGHGELIVRAS